MGRGAAADPAASSRRGTLTAFVDTNVLIRHLTGDPPEMAARATAQLAGSELLLLTDLVFAECVYVLESFYEVERARVALLMGSALALDCLQAVGTTGRIPASVATPSRSGGRDAQQETVAEGRGAG